MKFLSAGMLALAAAGQGLSGAPARAAVATFGVSGTMTPTLNAGCSPTCTLGGDIMFDNSAGAPHMGISADVTVTGFSPSTGPFTGFAGISAVSGLTQLTIDDASGDFVDLVFSSPRRARWSATPEASWIRAHSSRLRVFRPPVGI